jgi:hypothetical protein
MGEVLQAGSFGLAAADGVGARGETSKLGVNYQRLKANADTGDGFWMGRAVRPRHARDAHL